MAWWQMLPGLLWCGVVPSPTPAPRYQRCHDTCKHLAAFEPCSPETKLCSP